MQVPPQEFSQHTPSTQLAVEHSLPLPQAAPLAFRQSLPVVFVHIPSVPHTCGCVPTHWRRPGMHWPPQTPAPWQMLGQVSEAT